MSPAKKFSPPPSLLVAVMWALCSGVAVVASIRKAGPYLIDLKEFSPCWDKGSILVDFDVLLQVIDGNLYYDGNLTFPYAVSDEDLLTTIQAYKWGSTGGWGKDVAVVKYDIMTFMKEELPDAFNSTFGSMGVTGKPMPAGTYHVKKYFPRQFKIDKFPELEYGQFKLEVTQARNGTDLCCLEFIFIVMETGKEVSGWHFKKRMRHFG